MPTNASALALFLQYEAALRRQLARKLPTHEIPDALQEVYVRLSRTDMSVVRDPCGFVSTVARGVIAESMAAYAARRMRIEQAPVDAIPDERRGPDELAEEQETARRMHLAIDKLSPTYRAVVILKKRGYTYEAIATALGITVDTVDTYWRRAKQKLKDFLKAMNVQRSSE